MENNFDSNVFSMSDHDKDQLFQIVMECYGKDVWNYAYSLTCNKEAADDITQNTFLQVFRYMDAFQAKSTMKTWILTIARN